MANQPQGRMKWRAFRPGSDGDGARASPRFAESGSTFEPAHRQMVVADFGAGRRMECRYNRTRQTFWLRFGPGDYMESPEAPTMWQQMASEERDGFSADEVRP